MENLLLSSIPLERLKAEITESIKLELSKILESRNPEKKVDELITRKEAAAFLGVSLPTAISGEINHAPIASLLFRAPSIARHNGSGEFSSSR